MTGQISPKSLKDQNRLPLWITIAVNFAVFYMVAQSDALALSGLKGFVTGAANLLPVGLALIVTSIANGLLSADMKARLVFLRWHHALPGHQAFSKYGPADPRVDMDRVKKLLGGKLPIRPNDENRTWYRLFYKPVENEAAILHTHREFLFARDYASFAFLFLVGFGPAVVFMDTLKVALTYWAILLAQFLTVRQVAANYGVRLVTTALARKAATPVRAPAKAKT